METSQQPLADSAPWKLQECKHCGSSEYSLQWVGSALLCPACAAKVVIVKVGDRHIVTYWRNEYRLVMDAVEEAKVLLTAEGVVRPPSFMMDERFNWEFTLTERAAEILRERGIFLNTHGDFLHGKIVSACHGKVMPQSIFVDC